MTTFFEYACLAILGLGLTMVVYGLVWLHGIPHHIAEANDHPHKRAIHVACWLSVFTLHAIWPFVFLWAMSPRTRLPVVLEHAPDASLVARLEVLEQRLAALSQTPVPMPSGDPMPVPAPAPSAAPGKA
jgi:Protein of unknown function (DUF3302)